MKLIEFLRHNYRDIRRFGPGVQRRHLARLRNEEVFPVDLADYGRIFVRRNSWDLDLVGLVLIEGAYDVRWPPEALARLEERYREVLSAGHVPVIVNAGGYIGLSAIWFARRWPEARVVSVEPDEGNLALLRRNLAGRDRHTIIPAALGSESGKVVLNDDPEGCAIQSSRSEAGVDIVTVPQAVATVPDGKAFICSIDIEGFESDLFAADTGWIDDFSLVVIEPHDWREPGARLSANFQREMAARPYEIYVHKDALYYLKA